MNIKIVLLPTEQFCETVIIYIKWNEQDNKNSKQGIVTCNLIWHITSNFLITKRTNIEDCPLLKDQLIQI